MKRYTGQPRHCAACYGQNTDKGVDFEVAYDGPVVNQIAVVTAEGIDAIAIDDLVICDDCLKPAAKLIGLVSAPDLVDELAEARQALARVEVKLADSNRGLADMHAAHRSLIQRAARSPRQPENVPDPGKAPVAF